MNGNHDDHGRGFRPTGALGADGRLEGVGPRDRPPARPAGHAGAEPPLELDDHRQRARPSEPPLELAHGRRQRDASQLRPALELRSAPAPRRGRRTWVWAGLLIIFGLVAWRMRPESADALTERAKEVGNEALHGVRSGIDALRPAEDPLGGPTPMRGESGAESSWRVRKLVGKERRGILTLTSSPSGAEITIDGEVIGRTPWAGDLRWDVGEVIELNLEGYRPWRTTIEAGDELRLDAALRRTTKR